MRIAVVAPSCTLKPEAADAVRAIVSARGDCQLFIHPQCFLADGHFAGSDEQRLAALCDMMNDSAIDAIWFARGGYGSNRIAEASLISLSESARTKLYMGYSDAGFLLAGFHRHGLDVAWGPMPQDVLRKGGEQAIQRALDWLVLRNAASLEPALDGPSMAYNLTVLSNLIGTALEPDFSDVDLLIEEIGEHLYRIDRAMFHITRSPAIQKVRSIRLGRVSDILSNDPEFGGDETAIVSQWCARSGIPFGGRADIGHDVQNKIVPFTREKR